MIKKEGGTMDRDTIFLYVIAVIASCFGLINCIQFFLKGNKTAQTVGTIISFKTINPENSKFRNSKWVPVFCICCGKYMKRDMTESLTEEGEGRIFQWSRIKSLWQSSKQ